MTTKNVSTTSNFIPETLLDVKDMSIPSDRKYVHHRHKNKTK